MSDHKPAKRVSMKDVAEYAGVSRTTVSFVINDTPGANIPESTRTKVMTAVTKLGYRPNAIAQSLRAKHTQTIGFVSDVVGTTPYAGAIIQGAQDYAWKHNSLVLSVDTGGNPELKEAAVEKLLARQVDGILYAAMYHREVNPPAIIREVPTVLLNCFVKDAGFPSIVPDEVQGAYDATSLLIAQGHTEIFFINAVDIIPAQSGRLLGYQQALADHNLPYNADFVSQADTSSQDGAEMFNRIINAGHQPKAIFCFNDKVAMGVYFAAQAHGLKIPEDISVVGFDNQSDIADGLIPKLTTIQLPHYEMGRWAAEHLMQLIADPTRINTVTAEQHKAYCQPIIRRSI